MDQDHNTPGDDGIYEVVVQTATAEMGFGPFSRGEADGMADALRAAPAAFLSAMESHFCRKQNAERSARVGRLRQMHKVVSFGSAKD
ncbi:MAG TPA: hypothetical protein VK513_01505 [Terriglobales bacterium]|jgi:hypothetical protein|nr:hypothetical protein [Terriglobales bacterium]